MRTYTLAIILLGIPALCCLIYSAYQFISLILNRRLINYTSATIIDTTTVLPETQKVSNARLATVSFTANGMNFIPPEKIQVAFNASVGDKIKIAYYKDNPDKLFTPTLKKAAIFFAVGIFIVSIICINFLK